MPLTIYTNVHCNDIHFLTNKGKIAVLKIDRKGIAVVYKDIGIAVLKPVIDRLVFGFSPTQDLLDKHDPSTSLTEYEEYIKGSWFHDAKTNDTGSGLSLVQGVFFKKPPYKHYKLNLRYTPSGASESIFIQVSPKEPGKRPFIRFDMNPSRFNKKAIAEFRKFLGEELLVLTGDVIPYEDFIAFTTVYRADVAIDILGARPSDLEITPLINNKPSPHKSHTYKSATGRTETMYPKVKKGESSGEYIYDKRQQLLDIGKQPVYGDFLHSRYECRIENTTFSKLANAKNRCVRIAVRALDLSKSVKMGYVQRLFIRYALSRTLSKALETIPPKRQPKLKNAYETAMYDIWDAKKIWSYWPEAVKDLGL